MIWYAAFGSNLLRARFLAYLEGGPVPGSSTPQPGATDPSPPSDDRPLCIQHPLVFAAQSIRWGGGVCFVDTTVSLDPAPTLGRGWLITVDQLTDVWAQENRGRGGVVDVDRLRGDGALTIDDGWYRRVQYLGELDGRPVATITCEGRPEPNPPTDPYVEVVAAGLAETWGLSAAEIGSYLAPHL